MAEDNKTTRPGVPPLRLILGLLLGAAAVYFAAGELSLQGLSGAVRALHPGWAAAALLAAFAGQTVKVYRWRIMLSTEPDAPGFGALWVYHLSGQLGNILIPGPAGDVGRVVIIGGRGQGKMFTLGTVALEKILDLVVYGLILILILVSVPLPDWIENSAAAVVGIAAAAAVGTWTAIRYRDRLSSGLDGLLARLPGVWGERARLGIHAAAGSLKVLGRRPQAIRLALATAMLWTANILINHFLLAAFGLLFPLSVSALLLIVLQLGVSTNLVPGTIGLFEFLCVETLALFGVPREAGLAYGIVLHLLVLTPLVTAALAGALGGFWRNGE